MLSATNEMPMNWGLLLDKALLSGEVEYMHLAKQIALERAYMVRVADKNGWGVAAKMAASNIMNPISEFFGTKQEQAKIAVQQFYKSKHPRALYEQNHTFNG
ncbi:41168_t:CDS:2 [Gigaspora margarita]|uniref:41168_t:CDS:1 n=1 Tax=Gigaspora margarita TaxID=4874 RepID=A0ABN7V9M7_GIGMA|nr:41168_t:CDS:2 [Gigaspora margarita]